MKWRDRKIETRRMRVGDILPHPMNPKIHPESQLAPLRGLLETVGKLDSLKAYRSARAGGALVFFDGHCRQSLDPDAEWDVDIYDLTDAEADLAVATFDPIGWQAEQSRARLDELLREVSTGDAALLELIAKEAEAAGIVPTFAENTPGDGGDEFDTTPHEEQTRVRSGDIWRLGDHRLMCGDSTNEEDVTRLMTGERAILFATDPPYLVDYDGTNHPSKWNDPEDIKKAKNKDHSGTYHDWDSAAGQSGLFDGFISVATKIAITEDAAWYCWHASRRQAMLEAAWEKAGAFVHQQIIWVKSRPVLTYSWYMWAHEPCFFGWLRGRKPKRCASDYPSTTWQIESAVFKTTDHPTSKPIEVFAIPMRQHTREEDLCYEPFAGSGSQIIAAERLRRRCYAIEREPKYCDVILRRWEAETGREATLLERSG
jgi:DNA modification methylase